MTTTLLTRLGIILALLISLAGVIILRGNNKEKGARRFLLFLLGAGVLCQWVLFIMKSSSTELYNQPLFQATWLLAPSLLGIMVLILLNGRTALAGMSRRSRAMAGVLALAMTILFILNRGSQLEMEYLVLLGTLDPIHARRIFQARDDYVHASEERRMHGGMDRTLHDWNRVCCWLCLIRT